MPIPVSCPGCKATFKAPDAMAGRQASCPKCQTKLQIPAVAVAATLPTAKALPVATAAKPPLPTARPANPTSPAALPGATIAAQETDPSPPEQQSIFKKRWTIDKILINIIALIIFAWFMKGVITEVLFKGLAENQQVKPQR
jgi:hypothetical protein